MTAEPKIEVEDIDHLGLIAGIIDDIGIVEIIDQELGTHAQEQVSAGQVVNAFVPHCVTLHLNPVQLYSKLHY
jgi:hypothetical protein